MIRLEDDDRDNLCMALTDLFGPEDFGTKTWPEIWDGLTSKQQDEVNAYWTGMQAGLSMARKILKN